MNRSTPIIIAVCVVGALFGGLYGTLIAAFAGDASPNGFAMMCFMFWGSAGGACVGATPGLIWGGLRGMKWVWPFLGAAVGAVTAIVLEETPVFPGDANVRGPLYAGCVLVGFLLGCGPFLKGSDRGAK